MRIGLITPSYFPNMIGGSEVSVKLLAEYLVENGHKPIVFAFDGKKNSIESINGVTVVRCKTFTQHFWPLTLTPYVLSIMKKWENEIDIYHVYNVAPIPSAGLYRISGKKPVIATLNSYSVFCPVNQSFKECWSCSSNGRLKCTISYQRSLRARLVSFPYVLIFPFLTRLSKKLDSYIALSSFVKKIYVNFGFPSNKIIVIPNFADGNMSKHFSSPEKSTVPLRSTPFTVLYVGRLSSEKGIDILIRAFWKISKNKENIRLFLVGNGPDFHLYAKMVSKLNLNKKVTFYGHLKNDELYKVYTVADVMVHPGVWPEPFGRTLLEAMSFGVPLIVSNTGTPPEIVGNAGLVFKTGDSDDLSKKIELILSNSAFSDNLRSNCSIILKNHSSDRILSQVIALYQRVNFSAKQSL